MNLNIQESFNKELPADPKRNNARRQVFDSCFSFVTPRAPTKPSLVHISDDMANDIGLSQKDVDSKEFLNVFSGREILKNTEPYSMCYGGHQFGHWAGQLGDGRAINLTEVNHKGKTWMLQLKGAGETPYSRSADGLAVLRSSIREHLCSEAMYHLGVPTTRSLSLMLTGDEVLRDVMYDGNSAYEKGAVVCRVAQSFIRFGNFQIFAARKDEKTLRTLCNYTIRHFYPNLKEDTKDGIIGLFSAVAERTMKMILHWQRVGFVHGVMNTDNMSILGQTIDYGPYGWLEGYDPDWTPNTTDRTNRRYRFGQQANIALWNLMQLANALYPLVNEAKPFEEVLKSNHQAYNEYYLKMMSSKLGLLASKPADKLIIENLENILQLTETDMTIFFRKLSDINASTTANDLIDLKPLREAFYKPEELNSEVLHQWKNWLVVYINRLKEEQDNREKRIGLMKATNPKYVLRNYMAQLAIDQADQGDYALIDELYQLLKKPYEEQEDQVKWFAKRPEWARNKVGCSMLSCSS